MSEKRHEDTSISLDGMTIEQALKKVMDAGSYPEAKKTIPKKPASPRTSPSAAPY